MAEKIHFSHYSDSSMAVYTVTYLIVLKDKAGILILKNCFTDLNRDQITYTKLLSCNTL